MNLRKISAMVAMGVIVSCADSPPERVAVPPKSNESSKAWNDMQKNDGSGLFGGMLNQR